MPSSAPPHALLMWSDGKYIHVELPGKEVSTIITFSLTEQGLSRALALLRKEEKPARADSVTPITKPKSAQHSFAQKWLKEKGIIA